MIWHFFSLLPITKTFSTNQKLHFRSEVLRIAIEMSTDKKATYSSSEERPGSSHTSIISLDYYDTIMPELSSCMTEERTTEQYVVEPSSQQYKVSDNSTTHGYNLDDGDN